MLVVTLLVSAGARPAVSGAQRDTLGWLAADHQSEFPRPRDAPATTIDLRAASGATIQFKTHNGEAVERMSPQTRQLPHLVLYRNGVLTAPRERTLIVDVEGIVTPPAGVTVTLEVTTQHVDPDVGADSSETILVRHDSRRIVNDHSSAQPQVTQIFAYEFTETAASDDKTIPTPTDYFRVEITAVDSAGADAS